MSSGLIKWIFFGEGLLFIALGMPLALGRVRPNGLFGFRTAKTLGDPAIWYHVNRSSGFDLIVAGLVIAAAALLLPMVLRGRTPATLALANVGVMILALGLVLAKGLWTLRSY
jgi:uncharacterized membrane protein